MADSANPAVNAFRKSLKDQGVNPDCVDEKFLWKALAAATLAHNSERPGLYVSKSGLINVARAEEFLVCAAASLRTQIDIALAKADFETPSLQRARALTRDALAMLELLCKEMS